MSTNGTLKYATTCTLPTIKGPCGMHVMEDAFDVDIIGKPSARVESFIKKLSKHISVAHPDADKELAVKCSVLAVLLRPYLTARMFSTEDPTLQKAMETMAAQFRLISMIPPLTDAEIETRMSSRITMDNPDREWIFAALKNMQAYCLGLPPVEVPGVETDAQV